MTCEYRTIPAETHSQALKREYSEVKGKQDQYEHIFQLLREKPEKDNGELWKLIRSGEAIDTIMRIIESGDLLLQFRMIPETKLRYTFPYLPRIPTFLEHESNPYYGTLSLLCSAPSQYILSTNHDDTAAIEVDKPSSIPYHAVELVDPRFSSIKASNWTTVTNDNAIIVKLLQSYFLFEHPFFSILHKDYFLEDMAANRNRFCSPLLVNVVLAAGCVGRDPEQLQPLRIG